MATNLLKYSLGHEEAAPFNVMLLEAVINVLNSFQDFKTSIDKVLPIKCDAIIKYATSLLIVANAYSPI